MGFSGRRITKAQGKAAMARDRGPIIEHAPPKPGKPELPPQMWQANQSGWYTGAQLAPWLDNGGSKAELRRLVKAGKLWQRRRAGVTWYRWAT